jgi:transcription antitermination factor NusG
MLNFIKLTSVKSEHIKLVEPELCHYKSGDKVRIVEGDFEGVVGRVARIAGQQRVVVEINGLCMVTTAYIPSAFLEAVLV